MSFAVNSLEEGLPVFKGWRSLHSSDHVTFHTNKAVLVLNGELLAYFKLTVAILLCPVFDSALSNSANLGLPQALVMNLSVC